MTLLRIALKFSLWMQGLVGNYSLDTNMRAINANVSSSYVLYYGVAFPPRPLGSPSHSSPRRHMWRLSSHSRAWQPHQHTITIILSLPLSPPPPSLSPVEASTKSSPFRNTTRLPAVRWRVKCDFCKLLLNPATQESIYLFSGDQKAMCTRLSLLFFWLLNFILYTVSLFMRATTTFCNSRNSDSDSCIYIKSS